MIDLTPLLGPPDAPGTAIEFRLFPRSGRERWLLEASYQRPWHLETWPRANLRAQLIYSAARLLGIVGLHLPSRCLTLNVARGSAYDSLRSKFDTLAVFLGTPGLNRKFVVFAKHGDKTWFVKVPISKRSAALAQTEAAALAALAEDEGIAPLVPRHFWIDQCLAIEDVRLAGAFYAPLDSTEMIRVHNMLFARSRAVVSMQDLASNWPEPASQAHPDLETRTLIEMTRQAVRTHIADLDNTLSVECYLAHGDFTRWNVLRTNDGSARIIDWELYGQRPKFFDPFHYIVSQSILVDRVSAETIIDRIFEFGSSMTDRASIVFYFGLYLVEQSLTYCDLYERGSESSQQVHCQLRKWKELLVLLSHHTIHGQTASTK